VASASGESIKAALNGSNRSWPSPEVGEIYEGKSREVMDFGAFVNFLAARWLGAHLRASAAARRQGDGRGQGRRHPSKVKLIGLADRGKVRPFHEVVDR